MSLEYDLWKCCVVVLSAYGKRLLYNSRDEWSINGPLHFRLNFDLNKSRQKFHHSLKEHHKISNIPKFRCEML